jgi:hypothetical protein
MILLLLRVIFAGLVSFGPKSPAQKGQVKAHIDTKKKDYDNPTHWVQQL